MDDAGLKVYPGRKLAPVKPSGSGVPNKKRKKKKSAIDVADQPQQPMNRSVFPNRVGFWNSSTAPTICFLSQLRSDLVPPANDASPPRATSPFRMQTASCVSSSPHGRLTDSASHTVNLLQSPFSSRETPDSRLQTRPGKWRPKSRHAAPCCGALPWNGRCFEKSNCARKSSCGQPAVVLCLGGYGGVIPRFSFSHKLTLTKPAWGLYNLFHTPGDRQSLDLCFSSIPSSPAIVLLFQDLVS